MDSDLGQAILREAESWVGTPWRRAMCERGRGVDCLNFVGGVYRNLGIISHVPTRMYAKAFWQEPNSNLVEEGINEGMQYVDKLFEVLVQPARFEELRPGDMVTISQLKNDDRPIHAVFAHHKVANQLIVIDSRTGMHSGVHIAPLNHNWRLKTRYRIVRRYT